MTTTSPGWAFCFVYSMAASRVSAISTFSGGRRAPSFGAVRPMSSTFLRWGRFDMTWPHSVKSLFFSEPPAIR